MADIRNRKAREARLEWPSPALLVIGPVGEERGSRAIMDRLPYRAHVAGDCFHASVLLYHDPPRVVMCEDVLADGTWKEVVVLTAGLAEPPPVIVTSRLADDALWSEVLNLGGFDLLPKPLDAREVERVLGLAWQHWENCRQEKLRKMPALVERSGGREPERKYRGIQTTARPYRGFGNLEGGRCTGD